MCGQNFNRAFLWGSVALLLSLGAPATVQADPRAYEIRPLRGTEELSLLLRMAGWKRPQQVERLSVIADRPLESTGWTLTVEVVGNGQRLARMILHSVFGSRERYQVAQISPIPDASERAAFPENMFVEFGYDRISIGPLVNDRIEGDAYSFVLIRTQPSLGDRLRSAFVRFLANPEKIAALIPDSAVTSWKLDPLLRKLPEADREAAILRARAITAAKALLGLELDHQLAAGNLSPDNHDANLSEIELEAEVLFARLRSEFLAPRDPADDDCRRDFGSGPRIDL